jgi:F-type H+-transporting ATPase subunit epsilon
MKAFALNILDASGAREFPDICSFVGQDDSGSFGILAGHARMTTALTIGLARVRKADGHVLYLALPGGVLHFDANVLTVSTRLCLVDDDYTRITQALEERVLSEEAALRSMKESLRHMEEAILLRMWELGRQGR